MTQFVLNGKKLNLEAEDDKPLLWVLREDLKMTGTKFGCGRGLCGACTVHMNGAAVRSCVLPVGSLANATIRTIEGFESHPIQKAWKEKNVVQCGYCQPGQIMAAIALLESQPKPSDADIAAAMQGNLCRCGTYCRIREAIKLAASQSGGQG